jgi:general secretion pathway protein G
MKELINPNTMDYPRSKKNEAASGFTLIELLIVIAIIGLLAAVVTASLNTAREKARDAVRIAEIKSIQNALTLYYDECSGEYPIADGASGELVGTEDDGCPPGVTLSMFIASTTDPLGVPYLYGDNSSDNSTYCLGADLENDSHPQAVLACALPGADISVGP